MFHYSQEEISNAILHYLIRHPNAQDTFEGIVHWWLLEEKIRQRTIEIRKALKILVNKKFLLETKSPNAEVLYSLNSKKKGLIETIIKETAFFQEEMKN